MFMIPACPPPCMTAAALAVLHHFHRTLFRADAHGAGGIGKRSIRLRRRLRQLGAVLAYDQREDGKILFCRDEMASLNRSASSACSIQESCPAAHRRESWPESRTAVATSFRP